ncbi:MAG: SAM-dependent methyltransferase [Pseudohongiellaceae bacterium]|jgi:SAM-dependent methyltransferase
MTLLSKRETRRRLLQGIADSSGVALQLAQWFESPLGGKVLAAEKASVGSIIERMFGYHILQVGGSEDHLLLEQSPISHKIVFSAAYRSGGNKPVADNEQLPLASDTIDAVIIHHGLDFAADSHSLLREATRVLRPGGQMLIIGFNPFSQWGVARFLRRKLEVPWSGRFIAKRRLLDWLHLLDLHVEAEASGVYFPPIKVAALLERSHRLEALGSKICSPFGGIYYISCKKQVAGITPIVPKWKPLRARPGLSPIAENFRSKLH